MKVKNFECGEGFRMHTQQTELDKEHGELFKANGPMVSLGIQVCIGGLQSCEEIIPVWSVLDF